MTLADLQLFDGAFFFIDNNEYYAQTAFNLSSRQWLVRMYSSDGSCSYSNGTANVTYQCFQVNVTWLVVVDGQSPDLTTPVLLEVMQAHANCSVANASLEYAFGGFFDRSRCFEFPIIGLASGNMVAYLFTP